MGVSDDDIADVVLRQFRAVPSKGKPLDRGGGVREWIPLSGIVAQGWRDARDYYTMTTRLTPRHRER